MSTPVASSPVDPGRWRRTEALAYLSFGLPGMVGTLLLTLGALGVGWLPLDTALLSFDVVDAMRNTTAGSLLARIMIFFGVGILLQTWLVMGADLLSGWHLRTRTQIAILATWVLPLLFTPAVFSRDMYAYVAQGRLMAQGYDPYENGVSVLPGWFTEGVDPMWGETPAPYGPLWLLISGSVAEAVQDRIFLGMLIFRLLAVAGVIMMMYFLPKLALAHGIDPQRATWLGLLNPLIIMHFVAGGHNDALMVGLLLWAFHVALRGSSPAVAGGAALVATAAAIKPIALLALPFIGMMRHPHDWTWRQRIGDWVFVTIAFAAAFAAYAAVAGLGLGWIGALGAPGEVKTWLSPMTGLGMIVGGALQLVGLAETNETAITVFRAIGTVISAVLLIRLALKPAGRSAVRLSALAFAIVVVLGPVVQPWYLLWFLPLFVVTGLDAIQLRWTIFLTAAFAVHGMVEGSATVDSILELNDGLAIAFAIGVVGLIALASPRERALLLHDQDRAELLPDTAPRRRTAEDRIISGPADHPVPR